LIASKLKRALRRQLDEVLGRSGFRRISDRFHGDRYSRECDGIRCSIHLSLVPCSDALVVEVPSVSVRFDRVEQLIESYEDPHPLLTKKDIEARPTLSVQIGSTVFGGFLRKTWTVRQEEEVAKVADQIAAYTSEKGEPIFSELSKPASALMILASDDEKAKSVSAPDEMRAKKAIGAAFVFEGRDAAERMAKAKMAILKGDARSDVDMWFERFRRDKLYLSK
jgi:hypothetical protein